MNDDPILKLLGLPSDSETLDPKVQMEYDQVNNNIRALADIRFKLLALVPPLSGAATFALSRTLASDLKPSQYAIGLVVSVLGFLVALGLTIYDQRNSEIYNGLGGRAHHLEHRAGLEADPLFRPQPERVGGQYLEKPATKRYLLRLVLAKHDIGLALIYGSVLGAWFFPIVYALLALLAAWSGSFDSRVPLSWRANIALGIAVLMVVVFVVDLIRLDGTFSSYRWGTLASVERNATLFRIDYKVRGKPRILWGLRNWRFTVKDKDGRKIKAMPATDRPRLVEVRYKNNWLRVKEQEILYSKKPDDPPTLNKEEVNKVFSLRFLD